MMVIEWWLPSGYVKIAMENGDLYIVDLPSYKMVNGSMANCKKSPFWVDSYGNIMNYDDLMVICNNMEWGHM